MALVVFVVGSLLIFLIALLFVDGIVWPAVIAVFCGVAAATVLNSTDLMAGRSRRAPTSGRDDQRENSRVP